MTRPNPDSKLSVYLVCSRFAHRERMLASLADRFAKFTPISFGGDKVSEHHRIIRRRPNVTSVLNRIGLKKLQRKIDGYLYFPSVHNLAVAPAKRILSKLIENDLNDGFDVCLIQAAPPHGLCTLGLYLKRKFPSLKWIVDWQDLWTFDEAYRTRVPDLYGQRLVRLEKSILDTCDLNITTNPRAAEVLHTRLGVPREKVLPVSHPFIPQEREALKRDAESRNVNDARQPVKIGFLGRLSKPPKVPGTRVLKAVTDALSDGIDLEFHIFGDRSELTRRRLTRLSCEKIFLHEFTSHLEALTSIARCDFLLIALADLENSRVIMHAKWPHYLILNRPVIAMVPKDSFIAESVMRTRSGIVIDTGSDWGKALADAVRTYKNGGFEFRPDEAEIEKYSWDSISQNWVDAIDRATAPRA